MIMQHMVGKMGDQMEYEQTREQIINLVAHENAMARPTPMDLGNVDNPPATDEDDQQGWDADAESK